MILLEIFLILGLCYLALKGLDSFLGRFFTPMRGGEGPKEEAPFGGASGEYPDGCPEMDGKGSGEEDVDEWLEEETDIDEEIW